MLQHIYYTFQSSQIPGEFFYFALKLSIPMQICIWIQYKYSNYFAPIIIDILINPQNSIQGAGEMLRRSLRALLLIFQLLCHATTEQLTVGWPTIEPPWALSIERVYRKVHIHIVDTDYGSVVTVVSSWSRCDSLRGNA